MLRWVALLLAFIMGCSGAHPIRRVEKRSDETRVVYLPRTTKVEPARLEPDEFAPALRTLARRLRLLGTPRETVWRTFQLSALSGDYLYLPRDRKLIPMGSGMPLDGALSREEETLARHYREWCGRAYGFEGDCLGGALVGGRYLDLQGRYVLAMALSKSPVLPEMQAALGEMVSLRAIMSAALWTITTMLFLLALPEPLTKGLAASMAVVLVLWIGVDTLYNLVTGWFQLMEEVKDASTFEEIRTAGEKYGRLIGRDVARVFAMLAAAAIGQTTQGFMAQVQTLPGSAQVAVQAETQAGLSFTAASMVEEVAVTAEGMSIALPPGAVAMAATSGRGGAPCIETHHIATICNDVATARGGPWTPRFRRLFARAGLQLKDEVNEVPIPGHRGPHPEEYHRIIYGRLDKALGRCSTVADCRARLVEELRDLAQEIATPGTELNQFVTQGKPR